MTESAWKNRIVGHGEASPEQLLANEKNWRIHPRKQQLALAGVLDEVGYVQAVVVNKRLGKAWPAGQRNVETLVDGHMRVEIAISKGQPKVPVVYVDLDPDEEAKVLAAFDPISGMATADVAKLEELLKEIDTGSDELQELLAELATDHGICLTGETVEDEVPEPPDEPVTRPGDLWILGEHRLLCADSSKPEDVDRLLDGAKIQLINSDPPYNVRVEPRSNNAIAAGLSSFAGNKHHQSMDLALHPGKSKPTGKKLRAKDRPLANDFVSDKAFSEMLLAWFGNMARVLEPGRAFYVWGGYANVANYPPALKASQLYFSQTIIWDKQHPVLTRKDFMGAHEWCFYGWKEGAAHQFLGPNNIPDLWQVKKVTPTKMIHLTEKPVELAARAMRYSSRPGDNVLDLFGGSGSTMMAAEQMGRRAFLMELDPPYCDVICERWSKFTGEKPVRELAGKPQPKKQNKKKARVR